MANVLHVFLVVEFNIFHYGIFYEARSLNFVASLFLIKSFFLDLCIRGILNGILNNSLYFGLFYFGRITFYF